MSAFTLLIDRLKGGAVHKIDLQVSPEFLGPEEAELKFGKQVVVKGEAYLTDDDLIIHLDAKAEAWMPCAVCNNMIEIPLKVKNFYHTEPIKEIRNAIFDFQEALRESLLIELPRTAECNNGKCLERDSITPYMRSKKDDRSQFPFAGLDKDLN